MRAQPANPAHTRVPRWLGPRHVLLLGDSLMAQLYYSLVWLLGDSLLEQHDLYGYAPGESTVGSHRLGACASRPHTVRPHCLGRRHMPVAGHEYLPGMGVGSASPTQYAPEEPAWAPSWALRTSRRLEQCGAVWAAGARPRRATRAAGRARRSCAAAARSPRCCGTAISRTSCVTSPAPSGFDGCGRPTTYPLTVTVRTCYDTTHMHLLAHSPTHCSVLTAHAHRFQADVVVLNMGHHYHNLDPAFSRYGGMVKMALRGLARHMKPTAQLVFRTTNRTPRVPCCPRSSSTSRRLKK